MKMGKSAKTTLIIVVILSLLLGTAAFIYLSSARVKIKLRFYPPRIDLGMPAPAWLEATLELGKGEPYLAEDFNVSTILFEGVQPPDPTRPPHVDETKANVLHVYFNGPWAIAFIKAKLYHMGIIEPDPRRYYKVDLMITGELNDGTAFTASRWVKILIPTPEGPPPP